MCRFLALAAIELQLHSFLRISALLQKVTVPIRGAAKSIDPLEIAYPSPAT